MARLDYFIIIRIRIIWSSPCLVGDQGTAREGLFVIMNVLDKENKNTVLFWF